MTIPPDVPFGTLPPVGGNPNYTFKSDIGAYGGTDTRVLRDMAHRLNDVINVKDWGALGDGSTDDTSAIQAAIAYSYSLAAPFNQGGTVVFFPPGTYIVSSTINIYNTSAPNSGNLYIEGAGRAVTIIKGHVNGYIMSMVGIDLNTQKVCDMTIWNTHTTNGTGALQFLASTTNTHIYNCHFIGMTACSFGQLNAGNSNQLDFYMGSVRDCVAEPPTAIPAANATTPGIITTTTTTPLAGSIGFTVAGGSCVNNRAVGFDVGFGLAGGVVTGPMYGCTASQCRIGVYMGLVANGLGAATNGAIVGNVFDRCTRGIYAASMLSGLFATNVISGTTGPSTPATITGISWLGGTATATTAVAHNISGTQNIVLTTSITAWTPDGSGNQIVSATSTGATTFAYALTASGGGSPTGAWNYPLEYAIHSQSANCCVYLSNVMSARTSNVSFYTDGGGNQEWNSCFSMRGPYGWTIDTTGNTPGMWQFFNCGQSTSPPVMIATYNSLAGGQFNAGGAFEINLKDAQAQAAFGGIIAGGGSTNHYKVRLDGAGHLTRMA